MKNLLKASVALGAAVAVILACDPATVFYAEMEEPRLCKTILAEDLPPFAGTNPGEDLVYRVPVPIGHFLPLFGAGDTDGGSATTEVEIRLIEFALLARSGILDFNAIETAQVTVEPAPGSALPPELLVTYTRDPANLPGDRLVVSGDQNVNLVPYLFDASGSDAGTVDDGGYAYEEGSVLVEAQLTGSLPENEWTADVRVCIYARSRFNYLADYL